MRSFLVPAGALTFAALLLDGSAVLAQSLGDLARREAERRQSGPTSTKVVTNRDVPRVTSPAVPAAEPVKSSSATGDKAAVAGGAPGNTVSKGANGAETSKPSEADGVVQPGKKPVEDEAYWAGRLKALQDQLAIDQLHAEALQSRVNALTTDFANRDDPARRAVIANDRQRALAELERLREAVVSGRTSIDDLHEAARRAGVPPGWLR